METGHTKYLYSTHPRIVDNFNINQANITPLNNYYGTYILIHSHMYKDRHFHRYVGSVSFHSYVHGLRTFYRHVSTHFQFLVGGFVGIFHSTSNFSTCKLHYMYIYTLLVYIVCTRKSFSVL